MKKKNNNILCDMRVNRRDKSAEDKRSAILKLFLEDNPAFEVCLRNLQDRDLPDNDRIALKAYKDEPLAAQIKRYCLNLQSVLFTLSVFPDAKIPDEVLDGFFDMAGELIYVLHHLAEAVKDDADMGVPGLRCAPSGLRANTLDMSLISRQKIPPLKLLELLRGDSL
ncbi:MAG TPA: hypothetical protein ENJ08_08830 [Gammaproteobacteria bacterium]|nr:hypothetical protein [Gammaproteobacteria bacterium]